LLAKPGLDGHDQGAKVVAHLLRESGFEVIYTGLHQTPRAIASAALQEDVDIVGLSVLTGAHVALTGKVIKEMKSAGISEKPLVVGGNIPERDIPVLKEMGVRAVLPTGSRFETIVQTMREMVA